MSVLDWIPYAKSEMDDEPPQRALRDCDVSLLWELAVEIGHGCDLGLFGSPRRWDCSCGAEGPVGDSWAGYFYSHVLAVAAAELVADGALTASAVDVFCRLAKDWAGTIGELVTAANGVAE